MTTFHNHKRKRHVSNHVKPACARKNSLPANDIGDIDNGDGENIGGLDAANALYPMEYGVVAASIVGMSR
jgi:hypothetical protein